MHLHDPENTKSTSFLLTITQLNLFVSHLLTLDWAKFPCFPSLSYDRLRWHDLDFSSCAEFVFLSNAKLPSFRVLLPSSLLLPHSWTLFYKTITKFPYSNELSLATSPLLLPFRPSPYFDRLKSLRSHVISMWSLLYWLRPRLLILRWVTFCWLAYFSPILRGWPLSRSVFPIFPLVPLFWSSFWTLSPGNTPIQSQLVWELF